LNGIFQKQKKIKTGVGGNFRSILGQKQKYVGMKPFDSITLTLIHKSVVFSESSGFLHQ